MKRGTILGPTTLTISIMASRFTDVQYAKKREIECLSDAAGLERTKAATK